MGDFRDGVYYAATAFFAGDNPYDQETYVPKYPVGERCSLYSPLSFVMHAPFALLGYGSGAAEVTIVAPSVLVDDLELSKVDDELPKLPLVPAPAGDGPVVAK